MSLNGQNGKMARKWCRGPNVAAFKLIYALSSAWFYGFQLGWLIQMKVTMWQQQALTRLSDPGNPTTPEVTPLVSYSLPPLPPSTSSSTAGVAQTQLIQIVFMLSLCLYLCLSVCMSVLFACLVYLSVCLSIRLNSPSNCSVLYDLFRSITRSLVTESGSDITLWFCFDLLCSWFELLFGFYF